MFSRGWMVHPPIFARQGKDSLQYEPRSPGGEPDRRPGLGRRWSEGPGMVRSCVAPRRPRLTRARSGTCGVAAFTVPPCRCGRHRPASLHDTALGEKLEAITELDLGELEDIEPPLGYGRD